VLSVAVLTQCVESLSKNETLVHVLRATATAMPRHSWCLIGGSIYQTVWTVACGRPAAAGINDYDVFYFDPTSGADEQQQYERRIAAATSARIELTNQALITAAWFEAEFGCPKDTSDYLSLEDAISKASVSSPIVGVTLRHGELSLLALADADRLTTLEVFPNRKFRSDAVMPFYRRKCSKWHRTWPMVTFHDWDGP
jgi:hypothetical protein